MELRAEHHIAEFLCMADRPQEALAIMDRARPLYRQFEEEVVQLRLHWLQGQIARGLGKVAEAVEILRLTREEYRAARPPKIVAEGRGHLRLSGRDFRPRKRTRTLMHAASGMWARFLTYPERPDFPAGYPEDPKRPLTQRENRRLKMRLDKGRGGPAGGGRAVRAASRPHSGPRTLGEHLKKARLDRGPDGRSQARPVD
jgi:hypothetical protein